MVSYVKYLSTKPGRHSEFIIKELPAGWTLDIAYDEPLEAPFEDFGLPPAIVLMHNKEGVNLVDCYGRFLLWEDISGDVAEIIEPQDLREILYVLPEKVLSLPKDADLKTRYLEYCDTDGERSVSSKNSEVESLEVNNPEEDHEFPATDQTLVKYKFDLRGCSGWRCDDHCVGFRKTPFDLYGLPPAELLLRSAASGKYLVRSAGCFFFWNAVSNTMSEILEPRTFEDIDRLLGDEQQLLKRHM